MHSKHSIWLVMCFFDWEVNKLINLRKRISFFHLFICSQKRSQATKELAKEISNLNSWLNQGSLKEKNQKCQRNAKHFQFRCDERQTAVAVADVAFADILRHMMAVTFVARCSYFGKIRCAFANCSAVRIYCGKNVLKSFLSSAWCFCCCLEARKNVFLLSTNFAILIRKKIVELYVNSHSSLSLVWFCDNM